MQACGRYGVRFFAGVRCLHAGALREIVGAANVIEGGSADSARYTTDWLKQFAGNASAVVRPGSTAEVSRVLAHCHSQGIPIVPQGGNTGLVGGSVPTHRGEVLLSLERMNAIESIDEDSGAVVCGAGVVLQALDEALEKRGLTVPLDLGAKGSCMIGGNVSTNAGGLRLLRYGSLHGSVLGLEVVLADGTVLDCLTRLRKDNVGFDVKQLFIGAEGCLGVVTRVALLAAPRPSSVNVAMFGVESFDKLRQLLRLARGKCGEILSAVEFADAAAMDIALTNLEGLGPLPFPPSSAGAHPFFLLVETSGSHAGHDQEKLGGFLEAAYEGALIREGVVAADTRQAKRLWRLREDLSVGVSRRGHVFKYDVSLPLARMYSLVEATRERLSVRGWDARGVRPVGYGHLGDGNLHLNISTPGRGQDYLAELERDIEPWVYEWTLGEGGSISAEHGLGQAKASWLERAKPKPVVQVMSGLKALLDPKNLMNPGKVLPDHHKGKT